MSERFEDRFDPERLRRLHEAAEGSQPAAAASEQPPEPAVPEPESEPAPAQDEPGPAPDLDSSSENVLEAWPGPSAEDALPAAPGLAAQPASTEAEPAALQPAAEPAEPAPAIAPPEPEPQPEPEVRQHVPGELVVPPGFAVLEGTPRGERRAVGVVVSRFNGEVTTRLLEGALAELDARGVSREAVTVMPVPGAFELPLAAMALAKTRRFACIVALGCVIRGETPHFDFVAGEAASGLQLAAIETGVPVSFGVLTLERADQAEERLGKGAEAVVTALEMADAFANLRAAAAR